MSMVECHENWLFQGTQNRGHYYLNTVFTNYHAINMVPAYIKGRIAVHLFMEITIDC
jgi:hypothetical protein